MHGVVGSIAIAIIFMTVAEAAGQKDAMSNLAREGFKRAQLIRWVVPFAELNPESSGVLKRSIIRNLSPNGKKWNLAFNIYI